MKIIALTDTHTKHHQIDIPKGDILIFAGDFEIRNDNELFQMKEWLLSVPCSHIITIFGNHDITDLVSTNELRKFFGTQIHYLDNDFVEIEGIKIWGSSYSPEFNDWAWMMPDNDLKEIWDTIPKDTDIVVCHTMPYGILDQVLPREESVGSISLKDKIKEIQPKIFIGGHLHLCGGQKYTDYKTDYFNVAVLDEMYQIANPCTTIEV